MKEQRFLIIFLIFRFQHILAMTELLQTYNMLMIKERTNTNLEEFWNLNKSDNDPQDKKRTTPIYRLIPEGNFRSSVIDTWADKPPQEIGLLFFNNIGDLQFYMFFNTMNVSRNVKDWMTPDRLIGSMSFGMSKYPTEAYWNIRGYNYLFKSKHDNKAWFAISNRNLRDGKEGYPYFNVPSTQEPFQIVEANETAGVLNVHLLRKWGPYYNQSVVKVQAGSLSAIFVSRIFVSTVTLEDGKSVHSTYKLHYSQQHCGSAEQTVYRDITGKALSLSTNADENLEPLYLKCMWLTFTESMDKTTISLYGPSDIDFITLPVVVFRGFWYGTSEEDSKTTTDIVTTSEVTEDQTNTTLTYSTVTTPNPCTCICPNEHSHQITEKELQYKIRIIKETLKVNKSNLSSHKRKYISAQDTRLSAKGIGIVAGLFLGLAFIMVLVLDLSTLQHEFVVLKLLLRK